MKALIVNAHPESKSFNVSLRDAANQQLSAMGYEVLVTDLYAIQFNPVVSRDDFTTVSNPERFNVSLEQRYAAANGGLAPEIASELQKLKDADLLILQFPLWWFGMPAILKGWIDRVFVSGVVYGRSALYDQGKFLGKRAMACVTTGGPEAMFGPDSLNGDILGILSPLHRGVFAFTGMTVLPPFVCYHVPYEGTAYRHDLLARYCAHLARLDELEPLQMPKVADYSQKLGSSLTAKAR